MTRNRQARLNLASRAFIKGLSQEAVAHGSDIDRTHVGSLERAATASIDMIEKLASVLEIEPDELLRRATRSTCPKN